MRGRDRTPEPRALARRSRRQAATRLLDLLDRRGADSIVLRSHTAVAWYLDGARTHVSLAGDPVAAVVVRPDGDELRVFDNEADRLLAEELGRLGPRPGRHPRAVARRARARRDAPSSTRPTPAADLRVARASLLPAELARYRALCREVAEVLTDAATAARPSDAERDVAARLAADLVARGIDPLVTLVAGRSRLAHRHPLPTAAPIGDRAMLVVCGRRTRPHRERDALGAVGRVAGRRRMRSGASSTSRPPTSRGTWVGATDRRRVRRGHRGVRGARASTPTSGVGTTRAARPGTRDATRVARPPSPTSCRSTRRSRGTHRTGREGRGHGARASRRDRGADRRPALADDPRRRARSTRSSSTV